MRCRTSGICLICSEPPVWRRKFWSAAAALQTEVTFALQSAGTGTQVPNEILARTSIGVGVILMRMSRLLSIPVLSAFALAASGAAPAVIPVGPFRSVELHDGGNVVVRHGQTQRVTILMGDSRYTRIQIAAGQRLVIEKCQPACPSDYQHRIEVITPELAAVLVSNGGTVQSVGAFPAWAAIAAAVEQGGTIDIRSIPAEAVNASVDSGGRIFTTSRETLAATILSGGGITYWGDPRVQRTVRNGGVVARGTRADAEKPLSELNPPLAAIPPIPPIPPIRNDH